ncbi:MAG: thioesterase family protein [Bacteroidales bacterium]|jgi:predicted thioesterase|nr:thioesterase family protein [Bacteroidales bacterium]MDD3700802.1 thioesterase family protein [Bacteroidales bacterium]MDY0370610.1 thioesterase family protein [Bacteroidales bacterium]
MEHSLQTGLRLKKKLVVTNSHTATAYGSGTLDVFATPAMIALMEQTAMLSVEDSLPHNLTTVGTEICVQHLRPSALNNMLYCESLLTEINGRELNFEVKVWDKDHIVGKGTHTRFIVDIERFMAKIEH